MAALGIVAWTVVDELLSDDCEENDDINNAMGMQALIREDMIKCMQYYEHTVQNYLPDTFKTVFKMTPATVELLCQYLSECPTLTQREYPGGRVPIPIEKKVLMTVRFMASQETVKEISDRFAVTEFSFLRSKREVIDAINDRLLPKFVTWPKLEECVTIAERFENTGAYQLPNVIGAIDGIPIEAPLNSPNACVNRKGFHSIILQAVCLPDLKFTDICVGWPGRVHDAKVLRNSALWNNGFQRTQNGNLHLLGDGAYPLTEWLLTTYRDNGHLTNQQNRFNVALSSKSQVIV